MSKALLCGGVFAAVAALAIFLILHLEHGAQNTHKEDLKALFPRVNVTVKNRLDEPVWLMTSGGDLMENVRPETKTLLDAMLANGARRFLYSKVQFASIKISPETTVTIQSSVYKDQGAVSQGFWIAHGTCDDVINTFGSQTCLNYQNAETQCAAATLNGSGCYNLDKTFGILEEFSVRNTDGATFMDQSGVDAVQNLNFKTTMSGKQQTTCSNSVKQDQTKIVLGSCLGKTIHAHTQNYKKHSPEASHCTQAPHHMCMNDRKYLLELKKITREDIGNIDDYMDEGGFCFSTYASNSNLVVNHPSRQATYYEFALSNPPCLGCQCADPVKSAKHQKHKASGSCEELTNPACKKYVDGSEEMIKNTCAVAFNDTAGNSLPSDIDKIVHGLYYTQMSTNCRNTYRFAYDDLDATIVCQNEDVSKTDIEFNVEISM